MSDSSPITTEKTPLLTNFRYAVVKHVAAIVLPASNAFYLGLAQIWHFPKADEVGATVAAVNVFLGILMGISSMSYNASDTKYAGTLKVDVPDDGSFPLLSVDLDAHPLNFNERTGVILKVQKNPIILDQPQGDVSAAG